MFLYIKNMVCDRCKIVVATILKDLNLTIVNITLGKVEIMENPDSVMLDELEIKLNAVGFEIINDRQHQLIEKIKSFAILYIRDKGKNPENLNFSILLSRELSRDYSYLSQLFSSMENITIEKYMILQKIERAKELLKYDEMNLSQIADELGYSSVQHLSAQFKKVTGLTPSYFKKPEHLRKSLDQVNKK